MHAYGNLRLETVHFFHLNCDRVLTAKEHYFVTGTESSREPRINAPFNSFLSFFDPFQIWLFQGKSPWILAPEASSWKVGRNRVFRSRTFSRPRRVAHCCKVSFCKSWIKLLIKAHACMLYRCIYYQSHLFVDAFEAKPSDPMHLRVPLYLCGKFQILYQISR